MPATLPPHCVPILRVHDARASIAYYEEGLGCSKNWEHQSASGLPLFVSMQFDGATLFLSEHGGDGAIRTHAYLFVDDVDRLYQRCHEHGARVIEPPADKPWGLREMRVQDLDHNELRFATPIPGA